MDNEVDLDKLQMFLGVLGCPHLRLMGSCRVHGPTGPLLAAPAFSDVQATFNREHAYARLGALLKTPVLKYHATLGLKWKVPSTSRSTMGRVASAWLAPCPSIPFAPPLLM